MNAQIQAQLDRVEAALTTLVDSIASYNPSPAAAVALVSADEEFSKGLEELAAHQASYNSLLQLRATAEDLDDRIKSNLTLLAETRKELITSTPITLPSEGARPVPYQDVLGYARRIAKYTVPPTYRPPLPPSIEDGQSIKQEVVTPRPESVTTPAAAQAETPSHLQQLATGSAAQDGKALANLPPAQRAWLDRANDPSFTPWPHEDVIRRGALARIQAAVDQGMDPATIDIRAQAEALRNTGDNEG